MKKINSIFDQCAQACEDASFGLCLPSMPNGEKILMNGLLFGAMLGFCKAAIFGEPATAGAAAVATACAFENLRASAAEIRKRPLGFIIFRF